MFCVQCKKRLAVFPVPSRDVTYQTLPGREKFNNSRPVPEIKDPVFAKTSPKRSFSITKYERFGFVFTKTRVYKFGHRESLLSDISAGDRKIANLFLTVYELEHRIKIVTV